MKEPRKDGMAQKEQRRSQPEASFTEATGLLSRRRRSGARGPEAGATPVRQVRGRLGRAPAAGSDAAVARAGPRPAAPWRSAGLIGSSLRRSRGVCGGVDAAAEDGLEPVGDVGVVVEAEHAVGLGQRLGELLAVPLGHAADGDDGLGPCRDPSGRSASSRASTESFLAASTKPQVLTTATSASAASSTSSQPSAARRPASSSESTSLRAQPRVTRATVRRSGMGSAYFVPTPRPCREGRGPRSGRRPRLRTPAAWRALSPPRGRPWCS